VFSQAEFPSCAPLEFTVSVFFFLGIAGGERRSDKAPPASRCYSWTIRVSSLTIERIIYENVAARVGTIAGKTGRLITVGNAFDICRSFWSHGVQANQWALELFIQRTSSSLHLSLHWSFVALQLFL